MHVLIEENCIDGILESLKYELKQIVKNDGHSVTFAYLMPSTKWCSNELLKMCKGNGCAMQMMKWKLNNARAYSQKTLCLSTDAL